MTEQELTKCCQRGDSKAQELLYLRYADRMYRLARRYLKSDADAEDALVMAFQKVFGAIKNFVWQETGSLEAWIRKILTNQALMTLRSQYNFGLTENFGETPPDVTLEHIAQLDADDIMQLIAGLPTGYRTIFNLHVIEGYSHEEIAALLEISESTSRSQLFKAKTLLRKKLTKEGYHYGT